jgi:uncharacterized protein
MRLLAAACAIWVLATPLQAAFPRPDGHVNDFAGVLEEDDETYLESYLAAVERDTSAEVVIATVPTLDGMSIEEYAQRLFADWGIGDARRDNGVLLLVAPADRLVRIEVGYGLEGILPDGLAGEIIRAEVLPEFRAGNLRRGIGRGVDRVSRVIRGDPEARALASSSAPNGSGEPPLLLVIAFFATFVGLGGFAAGLGLRTRTIAPLVAASLFTLVPLFIAATLSPWSLAFLLPVEMVAMAFGYLKGGSDDWKTTLRAGMPGAAGRRDADSDGWVVGGSDSSGSSSSSGGSDFSSDFGGGSSGGGGASGRW